MLDRRAIVGETKFENALQLGERTMGRNCMMAGAIERLVADLQLPVEFDLACVGTSIHGLHALTLESVRYIAQAKIVYCYPVSAGHLEFLRDLNKNVIDLDATLYGDGRAFSVAYANIIEEVLASLHSGAKVVYACQGSPSFLAYTSVSLARRAKQRGLNVVKAPGVSSFECLLSAIGYDYDAYDVQLLNCASIVAGASTIDSQTPCFLFNVGRYASALISKAKNTLGWNQITQLIEALQRTYPGSHPIHIMIIEPDGHSETIETNILGVEEELKRAPPGVSLFIPPATRKTPG